MKILVLGGTGAMGVHLVKELAKKGNQVSVTSRRDRKSSENISYIRGDAHSDIFLDELLKEHWDVVIDFMVYHTAEFQSRFQKMLLVSGQYVFTSSARVYADSVEPLTEDSPRLLDVCKDQTYLNTDEYALAKARQENFLIDNRQRNWTIIRPYITFSENRFQLGGLEHGSWLYRALHHRTIVFSKDLLPHVTTLTYGADVAKGIAAVVGKEKAMGETFHITSHESHTWKEILDTYLNCVEKYFGSRPNVFLTEKSMNLHCKGRYQILYDRYYDRRFNNAKIGAFMDLSSLKPPLKGIDECLAAFIANPKFRSVACHWEAEFNRLTHEQTPLNEFPDLKQKIRYLLCRYLLTYL